MNVVAGIARGKLMVTEPLTRIIPAPVEVGNWRRGLDLAGHIDSLIVDEESCWGTTAFRNVLKEKKSCHSLLLTWQ